MLLNNTQAMFDPHPGNALSVQPGKRVTSSMAPTIVLRDGQPEFAIGLPGGVKIFTSVLQAVVNLVDHRMSAQEAVEAPRVWTQGQEVEIETGISEEVRSAIAAKGHRVIPVTAVGGGMNIVRFEAGGTLSGSACWRADGHAVGIGGGFARPGASFKPLAYGPETSPQDDVMPEQEPVSDEPGEPGESPGRSNGEGGGERS